MKILRDSKRLNQQIIVIRMTLIFDLSDITFFLIFEEYDSEYVGQRIECNRNRENREKIFELVETL
jgi:hypothetical protein